MNEMKPKSSDYKAPHDPCVTGRPHALNLLLLTLLALCLCLGIPVHAAQPLPPSDQLSETQVQTAVETWVQQVTADARPEATVVRMEPYYADDGEGVLPAGYIAHLNGGGFCLAGASRLLLPVYLYVPTGDYDPENPGFRDVLWEMGARLQYVRLNLSPTGEVGPELQPYLSELQDRSTQWDQLIAGIAPISREPESVSAAPAQMELPMTSQWGQGSPYNDQCPNLTPSVDERTLTGCGATAVAQVMYYWKWPNSGVGSHSINYTTHFRTNWDVQSLATNPNIPAGWTNRLEWVSTSGGQLRMNGYWDDSLYGAAQRINTNATYLAALAALWSRMSTSTQVVSANFGASSYNWSVMQNKHSDPVDDGDPDVAQLMAQVGVGIEMDYGVRASGTTLYLADDGLVNYFRYDSDITYGHPDSSLNQTIYVDEIQWLRPVPYCGSSPSDAHIWVIFGYNQATSPWQYKMNMGWNGGSDNWYSLDNVPSGLNNYRCHLLKMAPNSTVKFVGAAVAGDGSPANPYQNIEAALANVPNGTTLIFKAGSVNTFSAATLTINRPLTLKGTNVTIQK